MLVTGLSRCAAAPPPLLHRAVGGCCIPPHSRHMADQYSILRRLHRCGDHEIATKPSVHCQKWADAHVLKKARDLAKKDSDQTVRSLPKVGRCTSAKESQTRETSLMRQLASTERWQPQSTPRRWLALSSWGVRYRLQRWAKGRAHASKRKDP